MATSSEAYGVRYDGCDTSTVNALATRPVAGELAPFLQRVEQRRLADLAPSPDIAEPSGGALGKDGASWYMDAWQGGPDVNPDLTGRLKYEVYREMRLSDPAVRSLEWLFKQPIRSAEWKFEPAENDPRGEPAAKATADFFNVQFGLGEHEGDGKLDKTWDAGLAGSLMYLSMGAHGEELLWGEPEPWQDADGDIHIVRFLTRLAPRHVSSVSKIDVDPLTGAIKKVEQDLPGAKPIPGQKLVWYVNDDEGDPWGTSILRAAYGSWLFKKGLLIGNAIAWDRFASGLVVVRHPPGTANRREAGEIGRGVRTHERAWVTLEGPPPDQGGEWDLDVKTATINDPVALLRHYDAQIAMAGLQQFSNLGTSERGSRAVGDVLVDPFYKAVQSIADDVRLARQRYVVRRLMDVNFGPELPAPKLKVSKISTVNIAVLAQALADLSSAGFTFTDRETQDDVRDLIPLRHLPTDAAGAIAGLPDDVGIAPTGVPSEGGPITKAPGVVEVELSDGQRVLLPRALVRAFA